jgi:hypothetical protein
MGLIGYGANDYVDFVEEVKRREEQEVECVLKALDEIGANFVRDERFDLEWDEDTEDEDKKRGVILQGLGCD